MNNDFTHQRPVYYSVWINTKSKNNEWLCCGVGGSKLTLQSIIVQTVKEMNKT